MCTNTRFGVAGCLSSTDHYATDTLSLYDFWYVYHPKHFANTLEGMGLPTMVRKRSRPVVIQRDGRGDITAILCRNGWVLSNAADGHQERNVTQHPYGHGMVFPAVNHRSPARDKWCEDHGYLAPYRARQWCPVHRMLHGHVNFASPALYGDCNEISFREHYPQYANDPLPEFKSIPHNTFRCAACGKHRPTVQRERQQVWKDVHDREVARGSMSLGYAWDAAKAAEREYVCCGEVACEAAA